MRVNLGQGIKIINIQSDRSKESNYLIEFEVAQNAASGKRDLHIQFGQVILTKNGYGEIAATKEVCDGLDNDGDGKVDEDLVQILLQCLRYRKRNLPEGPMGWMLCSKHCTRNL